MRILGLVAMMALIAGCTPEMGRTVGQSDVACLRSQMSARVALSFPLAANTCQRVQREGVVGIGRDTHAVPLDLRGAPDLQQMARDHGYAFTS